MTTADWLAVIGAVIVLALWFASQVAASRRWGDLLEVLERLAYLLETDPADDD
jgi:nicotinamide riboside transporter PnuC